MKKYLLLSLFLTFIITSCGIFKSEPSTSQIIRFKENNSVFTPGEVQFLYYSRDNSLYFYSDGNLYQSRNGSIVQKTKLPLVKVICEAFGKTFAGTYAGLYELKDTGAVLLRIPARYETPAINALAPLQDTMWIGTDSYGLFAMVNNKIIPKGGVPLVTSFAVTSDSSMWYGTHTGLARINKDFSEIYSEEIQHRGLAIPDNIIENLCTDKFDNLWVIMPHQIMVLTPSMINDRESDHMHPNTIPFIGNRENNINKMVHFDNNMNYWVLGTDQGMIILKNIEIKDDHDEHQEGMPDVLENQKGDLKTFTFTEKTTGITEEDSKINDLTFDNDGNLFVANKGGLWFVPQNLLNKWSENK